MVLLRPNASMMSVDKPTDQRVKKDDENGSQGRQEKEEFGSAGEPFGALRTCKSDQVEQEECRQAQCRVKLCSSKVFQDVDYDLVSCRASVEAGDTHQCWDLSNGNVDGRASHECRDGR